jgi:sugar-specific transcriptional regulator TrmB
MQIQQLLLDLWLSQQESDIFLCLVEIGQAPASVIARRVEMQRLTVYNHLNHMKSKWYIQSYSKNNVTHFAAIDPTLLLEKQQHICDRITSVLPMFWELSQNRSKQPQMEYYEWLEALKRLYTRILDEATTKEITGFLSSEKIDPKLQEYLYTVSVPDRIRRQIYAKILVPNTDSNKLYISKDPLLFKETRTLQQNFMDTTCEINLFGENKIAIIMYATDELCAVYFSNIHLYRVLQGFFTYLWEWAWVKND